VLMTDQVHLLLIPARAHFGGTDDGPEVAPLVCTTNPDC
jgi:hypothetical protein